MTLETADILLALRIGISLLGLLVLYHLLFITVDLRRILKRIDHLTREVEDVIMKPLSMADAIVEWLTQFLEEMQKKHGGGEKKKLKAGKKKK